ncbi:ankyrin-1-like [Saccostrea echinata]|uniref:ankyrin-1-like n=1 Tax=Saccostrea echinata TaxID=191078 RepID=UPI002A809261|nr:ankyrin-1-like [Saccostrea echinata]
MSDLGRDLKPSAPLMTDSNRFGVDSFLKSAEDGEIKNVQSYRDRNLDTNVVNSKNQTALHLASRNGHIDVVALLVEDDAFVNLLDKEGKTPLYYAVESNNSNIVEQLLKCDNIEVDSCGEGVVSPLFKAVQGQFKDIVEMLSLKGANIYLQKRGSSPILEAVSLSPGDGKKQDIVEILYRNSANVCNEAGETILHIAIRNNNERCIERFIDITNINLCDKQNRSPLFVASCFGNRTVVNMLLKRHAKINEVSTCKKGDSALHVALRNNHFKIAEKLLKCGANPRIVNKDKETPLNIACSKGDTALDIVKSLVNKHGVKVNADGCNQIVSPLFSALRQEGNDIRIYLVFRGATLNTEEIGQALVRGARHGFVQNVKFLLPLAKDINSGKYSKYSDETPLHAAVKRSHEKIVYLLIRRDVDVNVKDPDGKTPLHYAKTLSIVKELVKKGAIVNAVDNTNRTPLFEASIIGITKYLCESGANVRATTIALWTPLHEACQTKDVAVVKYLIAEKQADINAKDVHLRTPLHAATEGGNFEVVKTLIDDYNCVIDINVPDEYERTPLHEAVMKGNLSIVKLLLDYEANENAADKDKRTPLHHAALGGNICIVECLVQRNADVSARDKNGKTAEELTQNQEIKDLLKGQ